MPASEPPKPSPSRLSPGMLAPDFSTSDVHGRPVSIAALRGYPVLLAFHRFAKCPFCNLRIHQLIQRFPDYAAAGLHAIAVFESSPENIRDGVGAQNPPFSLVSDIDHQFYKRYGVERSVAALAKGLLNRMSEAKEAIALGLVRSIARDGSTLRVPAEFLIAPNGRIFDAYYGNDIADHIPFEHIEAFLRIHGRSAA